MTEAPAPRLARLFAWTWLLLVAALVLHQWSFWRSDALQSDVLALLPADQANPELAAVGARIADAGSRKVIVLLGSASPADATRASQAFAQSIASSDAGLQPEPANADWFASARDFYGPHRDRLLTPTQRDQLRDADPAALAERALMRLYGPLAGARLTDWRSDPLGLWPEWWVERAAGLDAGEGDLLQSDGRHWAVLRYELAGSAFRVDGEPRLQTAIDVAHAAARAQAPDVRFLGIGVPLHAEAAAVSASAEVSTIGLGSLLAVLLFVWMAFGSLRPIVLVALTLVIGTAAAVSVTALVFGEVHLLTLVFGASLVGVAEDYGIHWFAYRQGRDVPRWTLLRALLPGLALALMTSAAAYLLLGVAPFPGLRQMALFAAVGLTTAFLTAILWFPFLDRGALRETWLSRRLGNTVDAWPRWRWNAVGVVVAIAAIALVGVGLSRLRIDDSLRSLQSSPQSLIDAQREASTVLRLPSPAQYFFVQGDDVQQVLQREEALTERLRALAADGRIAGWRAVSDWLPSQQRQDENAALAVAAEQAAVTRVAQQLDEDTPPPRVASPRLDLQDWLDAPASEPARALWHADAGGAPASVVLIDGLHDRAGLDALATVAEGLHGVRWVDRTEQYSALLAHYRHLMGALLLCGHVLVFVLLLWRYRRDAWRASLPTAIASLLAVATLALLGQPLQLFTVLALLVLLGMGIDYGIFLLEHEGDPASWMAVCIGAASTWLAFGLLALSSTPALRAFGLTLLIGIALVWALSPLFRRRIAAPSPSKEIHAH